MIRKTRNVTLAISEERYRRARVWAADCDVSLSAMLQFLLEHAPDLGKAMRLLHANDPNWGADFKPRKR